jgi:hypothetical protein
MVIANAVIIRICLLFNVHGNSSYFLGVKSIFLRRGSYLISYENPCTFPKKKR